MNHASQPCCQVDLKLHVGKKKNECDQQRKFMGEAANEVIGADDEFSTSRHSFFCCEKKSHLFGLFFQLEPNLWRPFSAVRLEISL